MGHVLDSRRKRARFWACAVWVGLTGLTALVVNAPAGARYGGVWARAGVVTSVGWLVGRWVLVKRGPRVLPVLNYHSVSPEAAWMGIGDRISLAPETFERQLAWLARHRYRTVFASEVQACLDGDAAAPMGPVVALTFDDGYVDNWTVVMPLLRRFGMKATIFVSTDFVADTDDAVGHAGYLTWAHLREMEASGLVEVQSHGAAHTRVMARDQLAGFVTPRAPNLWLLWNTRPETRRIWWQVLAGERSLWGHPVYPQRPALAARAFSPNPAAVAGLLSWTRAQGEALFARPEWESILRREWTARWRAEGGEGVWERSEDFTARVADDLRRARETLARELGAPADLLCWPEGVFTEAGEAIARRVGYRATVANGHDTLNEVGRSRGRMARVFVGSGFMGRPHVAWDVAGFVLALKVFEGWYGLYPLLLLAGAIRRVGRHAKKRSECPSNFYDAWQ